MLSSRVSPGIDWMAGGCILPRFEDDNDELMAMTCRARQREEPMAAGV